MSSVSILHRLPTVPMGGLPWFQRQERTRPETTVQPTDVAASVGCTVTAQQELRREQLIAWAIGASSFSQIVGARRGIQTWLAAHPEDTAMRELDKHLERLEKELHQQTAEAVTYNTTLAA